jgi:hypothetical protein
MAKMGGQPPFIFLLFDLLFFILTNLLLIFFVSGKGVSFVALGFLKKKISVMN